MFLQLPLNWCFSFGGKFGAFASYPSQVLILHGFLSGHDLATLCKWLHHIDLIFGVFVQIPELTVQCQKASCLDFQTRSVMNPPTRFEQSQVLFTLIAAAFALFHRYHMRIPRLGHVSSTPVGRWQTLKDIVILALRCHDSSPGECTVCLLILRDVITRKEEA